jgi:hypothetical protein
MNAVWDQAGIDKTIGCAQLAVRIVPPHWLTASFRRCAGIILLSSVGGVARAQVGPTPAVTSTTQPVPVAPGYSSLRPDRVVNRLDTLTLLVTPKDSTERVYATLVRAVSRTVIGGAAALRETQHYMFATGRESEDTLDVLGSTLAPIRYFSARGPAAFDVRIDGKQITGWQSDSIGARSVENVEAPAAFFVSIMDEAFIAALPLELGASISMPLANPPARTVQIATLRAVAMDTITTANGKVACLRIVGPGNTTTMWIAQSDHRLVRMHWTLPNGMSIWKLPMRDAALR